MKKFSFTLLALVIAISLILPVNAQAALVMDEDDLLSATEERQLESVCQTLSKEYGFHPVIVTVPSLGGKSPQGYAESYFLNHGYGLGEAKDGVLILISMEQRDWAIITHGNTMDIITDDEIDEIAEEILSDLSKGNFYHAFDSFLDQVEEEYQSYKNRWIPYLLIALGIGAVVAAIALLFMRKSMNTARQQSGAGDYMDHSSYDLYQFRDIYLYSRTTKVAKAQNSSSGSRGGGSRSFGGRSGKF